MLYNDNFKNTFLKLYMICFNIFEIHTVLVYDSIGVLLDRSKQNLIII